MQASSTTILATLIALVPLTASTSAVGARVRHAKPPHHAPKAWRMPWQLSLASAASRAQGERTYVVRRRRYGRVRGTRIALHYLAAPLPKYRGRNGLVKACRATVARSARKLGPVRVEAASAGPQRRTRFGYAAPIGFRLVYARYNGREDYEVRQGVLTCTADRFGRIRNAYV